VNRGRRPTLAALLVALALAGCDDSEDETETPPPPPPPPKKESVQRLPKLPDDWERHVSRAGGFAFGVPRGWEVSDRGDGSLIRSFDRLVAISIVPDRSDGALELPVDQFATRAAEALPGFRERLRLKGKGRFEHRYEGAEVRAVGTAKGGIDQRVSVIVLRRDELATFTVVIAKNQREEAHPSKKLAERIVETLRSRPPREPARKAQRSGRSG
jgi:hypothetical protein